MSSIEIVTVDNKNLLREFVRLPWKIYKSDKFWVPPLIVDQKNLFDKSKHPFFLHSSADFFLARRSGEFVGRIAAILNNNHNKFHNEKTGFFGFFESVNDREVSTALFNAATEWAREKGMQVLRGPMNYSTNETCGLLVEGFDSSPYLMMTYNPRYYVDLVEGVNFSKVMDLYAWYMSKEIGLNPKIVRVGEKIMKEHGLVLRQINMKDFWREVELIKRIYNDAWTANWGFVPMTDAEFDHLAKDLKPVVDPRLVIIAEKDREPVGFSLALPDMNRALIKANGRLLPFGLLKILYHARKIRSVRVITLGVVRKLQTVSGIGAALYMETYRRGIAAGYVDGEFSWTLENNIPINRGMELLGAKIYKRYRIYEKAV